jgi:hypothetical protein
VAYLLEILFCGLEVPKTGWGLFHVAARLRANNFNYISLETALSDSGIISQVPLAYISIMSSGRSNIISCGNFGTIEFVHTSRNPLSVMKNLDYDWDCHLWRADVQLALDDIKITRRNTDLIDWEAVHELYDKSSADP